MSGPVPPRVCVCIVGLFPAIYLDFNGAGDQGTWWYHHIECCWSTGPY